MIFKFDKHQIKDIIDVYMGAIERISYPNIFRAYWDKEDFIIEVFHKINTSEES